MHDEEDPWLKLSAIAPRIGKSREFARQLVVAGVLSGTRHGERGGWQVRASECDRYLASLQMTGVAA